jgi:hypothetical protein
MGVRKTHSFGRQLIKVRRLNKGMAIAAQITIQIIADHEQHVGRRVIGDGGSGAKTN